ncbi:hypothetical protein A3H66_01645 [Candidatus Falkowbacteria bacterium RIFCSPLOWO2_02_FULL_45_21]|uniref:Uncharacterized protein n=1 Tax=Candidatus Falkowbacteria bacterium RIFCSPLOWO2_02_FULL_45_21 TaxID=1797989 RepID=A0A1F5SCF7_9BACT|nr:MAG: hypothetical protein A3H66_01645 [Candidatus Falkowbacteria bacterium RIFCSPLOWO2_02_FULL_45_21]
MIFFHLTYRFFKQFHNKSDLSGKDDFYRADEIVLYKSTNWLTNTINIKLNVYYTFVIFVNRFVDL